MAVDPKILRMYKSASTWYNFDQASTSSPRPDCEAIYFVRVHPTCAGRQSLPLYKTVLRSKFEQTTFSRFILCTEPHLQRTGVSRNLRDLLTTAISDELKSTRALVKPPEHPGPAGGAATEGGRRELAVLGRWVVFVPCDPAVGEETRRVCDDRRNISHGRVPRERPQKAVSGKRAQSGEESHRLARRTRRAGFHRRCVDNIVGHDRADADD